ncbi:hypothetical protein JANAI62_33500 [Jannaschia pagri]|uniref:Lysozyme inhibitor LprI-like N-terminal domain-containing protein n=1 Tax=Jannaschia pagri TaxID=2829797 RepID=A0ABQ4NQN7_9RHOB|nr:MULTISPECIES: lysozyme inhibitor LprI family protein [unclassified Jannaschia]GIT92892.1 hypothetical protein JANAI61_33500 [Jannaschia sp. AI_61]GIT96727.1 hypothetical protein JANAI62_33500 [Jannaschia sp. AI_62]
MIRALLILLLSALPALAQAPDAGPWSGRFAECVHGMDAPAHMRACIGQAARLCMDETEGGHTTIGQTGCQAMEKGLWDDLLNSDWPEHRRWAEAADAAEREVFGDTFSKRAEALRSAQRAWIAFRDAECGLAYALWGSGSMRNIAASACEMQMTAERVIDLREMSEGMR